MFLNKKKLNMNRHQLIQLIHLHNKIHHPTRKVTMTTSATTVYSGLSDGDKRESNKSSKRHKNILSLCKYRCFGVSFEK